MNNPQYLLAINRAPKSVFEGVASLKRQKQFADLRLLILTTRPGDYANTDEQTDVVACSFESDEEVARALKPYQANIRAVVCRGDRHIQDLRRVIPFLPQSVLVSTPKSLELATNKRLMRAAFKQSCPEISLPFTKVSDDTDETIDHIEAQMSYPVIIKPANLASSLLIESAENRSELKRVLTKTFAHIEETYHAEGRRDKPQVIVEEYLTGDYYSIDAYVMKPGEVYFCPPVAYVSAKQLDIDDFFLYKRFTPTKLNHGEIVAANAATAKAIAAIGLTHTSVHMELILTSNGWKVIELGPRIGNLRDLMYRQSFGIMHALNDLRIRFGQTPRIPEKLLEYSAGYRIYPLQEGTFRDIRGLDYIQRHPTLRSMRIIGEPGSRCKFAKHGGHALAEFVLSTKDKRQFDEVVSYVEKNVEAIID